MMYFHATINQSITDDSLISSFSDGNKEAFNILVRRYQGWIYNVVLRMVLDPWDAEDITQEILLKVYKNLSDFKGKSKFSTWLYRIAVNHVINVKKRVLEKKELPFTYYWKKNSVSKEKAIPDKKSLPVELSVLIEETRIGCMLAMLMYLNREHRMVYILGEIFGADSREGSEILGISEGNFRVKLHRARKRVYHFMRKECGLINEKCRCTCEGKIKTLIGKGSLNPDKLRFTRGYKNKVKDLAEKKRRELNQFIDRYCRNIYLNQPFYYKDFVHSLEKIIDLNGFTKLCDSNGSS
jgi:RNA polymerase sigma factor (sigma-70 family)